MSLGGTKARRGQPVAKLVAESKTQPMPVRDREKDREMLERVKEFDGDDDKLLVEYQQDIGIDIDRDIESCQPGEFDHELKDCAATRIATSAATRIATKIASSVASSSSVSSKVASRLDSSMEPSTDSSVYPSVPTRRARKMCQSSWKPVESRTTTIARGCTCRWPTPVLLWTRQMQVQTARVFHTVSSCNECRQVETIRIVAIG